MGLAVSVYNRLNGTENKTGSIVEYFFTIVKKMKNNATESKNKKKLNLKMIKVFKENHRRIVEMNTSDIKKIVFIGPVAAGA
jgi:hypothetical protein